MVRRNVVTEDPSFANSDVLEFYKSLPFNFRDSVEEHILSLKNTNPIDSYPPLSPLLGPDVSVLDVGCGTGWLSNSIAYRFKSSVTGIDFNPVAVRRATQVAQAAGLTTVFRTEDLFFYKPKQAFDVIVSIGVLHHTDNCHAALRRCCTDFVRPGGHVMIGLYHTHGRRPLLNHFRDMRAQGATTEQMFARYRQLHSQLKDETLLLSWFRDQVLHPRETQHTLEEMIPLLEEQGMDLISTSINRFGPVEPSAKLIEAEKTYEAIGQRRLQENQYFPGFFVFLARKRDGKRRSGAAFDIVALAGEVAEKPKLYAKPYLRHHSIFGYEYIPDLRMVLSAPGGGRYTIEVNSAGIRSSREYRKVKPRGVFRILVCGDSMPAGQFISNEHRFSEILERRIPNLEVINLALEGSGTDQQLLIFEHVGLQYEFDLVMLLPFLQNIRRNMADAREGRDPATLERILIPKPRYELVGEKLVLRNVPVSTERKRIYDNDYNNLASTDIDHSVFGKFKQVVNRWPVVEPLKKVAYGLIGWEPFPEYRDSSNPAWRLMGAICSRFKELAGDKPLVIAPTFYSNYARRRMARNYWIRFSSLTSTPGIFSIDLLPYFKRLGQGANRAFLEPHDMHFSGYGHVVLAEALQVELSRLKLLPEIETSAQI